jgi:hypothetical protein
MRNQLAERFRVAKQSELDLETDDANEYQRENELPE